MLSTIPTCRYENDGFPYRMYVFFGEPEEDSTKWISATNLIGTLYTFGNPAGPDSTPGNTGCGNCDRQNASNLLSSGQIPLFTALAKSNELETGDHPRLDDLTQDNINNYLEQHLHWGATKVRSLSGFQLSTIYI